MLVKLPCCVLFSFILGKARNWGFCGKRVDLETYILAFDINISAYGLLFPHLETYILAFDINLYFSIWKLIFPHMVGYFHKYK